MTKTKKVLLLIISGLLFVFIGLILTFSFLGRSFLVIEGNPKQSEAIIVLSGDDGRLEKAAELHHEGLAEIVILSTATEYHTTKEEAIELGIPANNIIEEKQAVSTYSNATLTKEIMVEKGLKSAIVVTSNYHSRRASITFNEIFQGTGIDLSYAIAPSSFTTDGKMASFEHQITFKEYVKITGYWLRLFISD